jgi:hypothetical protein
MMNQEQAATLIQRRYREVKIAISKRMKRNDDMNLDQKFKANLKVIV